MSKNISVKPIIEDGKIIKLEVEDVLLPLREDLSLDKLQQLISSVENFFRYIDVDKLGESLIDQEETPDEWKDKDLKKFVITQLRDSQAEALGILVASKVVTREQFITKMRKQLSDTSFRGWSLGGLLAGITMKSKSWGYESPYDREWRNVGNKWKCVYYLRRDDYRSIIKNALKER